MNEKKKQVFRKKKVTTKTEMKKQVGAIFFVFHTRTSSHPCALLVP